MRYIKCIMFCVKKYWIKRYWRKSNSHNSSSIGVISNIQTIDFLKNGGVLVGVRTYGKLNIHYSCGPDEKLIIGKNCSISGNSHFLLGGEHKYTCISTFPFAQVVLGFSTEVRSKGPIIVEDETWIGDGAWIMSGVTLGKGSIIGAGAIVTKNVPPYSIVSGNPAKIIKMRFSDSIIERLLNVDIDLINVSEEQARALNEELNEENIDRIINLVTNERR